MIREIHPHRLFLGNALDARDLQLLYDNRIGAVVDFAINELPAQLARDIIYCRIPIYDGEGNADAIITTAIKCVVAILESDIRTLVACSGGMSRSPAIAAAAMSIALGRSPDQCLTAITTGAPHDVSPPLWAQVKAVCDQMANHAG